MVTTSWPRALGIVIALSSLVAAGSAPGAGRSFILQSTTSTANSGLYEHILPMFEARTGIRADVVAVGTGQALKNARNGDGDVLLVHARSQEEAFVAEGWGVQRFDVMYNDFVIVGPAGDPAGISGLTDARAAFAAIAGAGALFASRGDNSGTHQKEVALWREVGIDAEAASGTWYRETGSGMGATLNAAVGMGAYALSDRATWISFANRREFEVLVEGDSRLFNQYGVLLVNPDRHPHVKAAEGQAFIDWIVSAEGQAAIAGYRLNGEQLFYPNAGRQGVGE